MSVALQHCQGEPDFLRIGEFLQTLYQPGNQDGNWFRAIWEYAYTHSMFDQSAAGRIGMWMDQGQVVAVATYELYLGEAFFNVHPAYGDLKRCMLEYAEEHLSAPREDGKRHLRAFISDFDTAFEHLAITRGYQRAPQFDRPMSQFVIPSRFPQIRVPEGFRLKSLADDNDLSKVLRVLHRGFNHPGEPPANGIDGLRRMQSGPNYRPELTIVVEAADGQFVSFAGVWYDRRHRFGYVEPVATDPAYRRRGLARAAVLEGIRRCNERGATLAYVATTKPLYMAIGFKKLFANNCWVKEVQPAET